jgi:hypothetical protein
MIERGHEPVLGRGRGRITAPAPARPFTIDEVRGFVVRRWVGALALFVVLDVLVLGEFLFASGLPMHGDFAFPLSLERFGADVYPLWNEYGSVSNLEDVDRLLVTLPLVELAQLLGLSMGTFVKAITLGTLLLSQVAMFVWARMLLADERFTRRSLSSAEVDMAAATAAVFFGFSPWVMPHMSAWFFWLAYAVTPLLLFTMTWAARDRSLLALPVTALVWSIGSGSPQYTLFLGVLLLAWSVFLVARRISNVRYTALSLLAVSGLYVLINAYWIWPILRSWFVQAVSPGYIVSTADVDLFSRNSTAMNVLLGRDEWLQWWDPPLYSGDSLALWNFAAVALLGFCCLGAFVARNRAIPFVGIVLVVSFFLTQGSRGPLGSVYTWLVVDAPGAASWGWLVRVPEKFGAFMWFAFATLLAFSTAWLLTKLRGSRRPAWLGTACVISVALFVTLPKLVSGTWGPYVPVDVPPAYAAVNGWLDERKGEGKALWLGRYETGAANVGNAEHTWASGRWAGNVFGRSSSVPSYGGYQYTNPFAQYRTFVLQNLDSPALWKLLAAQGIAYVVYQSDIAGSRAQARTDVANLSRNLEPAFRRGQVRVFLNERVSPHVTAPSTLVVADGGMRGLRHLAETTSLDPRSATVVFRDQHRQLPDLTAFDRVDVSYDVSPRDRLVDRVLARRGSVVWPFDRITNGNPDAGWARVRTSHQFDGDWPWHRYVQGWLQELDRWELDRGRGIVLTREGGARMSLPVTVAKGGVYDVYVRLLRHPHGGRISITAGGKPLAALSTVGPDESFGWELVATRRLDAGRNVFAVESDGGHTAIAAIGVLPAGAAHGRTGSMPTFIGETTRGRLGNLARVVASGGGASTLEAFAARPRRGPAEIRLVPGGGRFAGQWAGNTLALGERSLPRGEYFALVSRGSGTLLSLRSAEWTPVANERVPRFRDGAVTARLMPGLRRQSWRSRVDAVGTSETATRILSAELSATSVRNFQMEVVWRRGGRITRVDALTLPQTGTFRRLFATVLTPPARTRTMELRVRASHLPGGGPSAWRMSKLEVTAAEGLMPYSTVLVGANRLERALAGSNENAVPAPPSDSPTGPIRLQLKRASVVRLAESYDPYWSGRASGGVDGRQLIAYGSINAFTVPVRKSGFEIEYSPQSWTVQGAALSLGALGLLGVGLFVRTRRWLKPPGSGSTGERA